jgi:hypothetical protein
MIRAMGWTLAAALLTVSGAWAQSKSGACTEQILKGDYGFIVEGEVLPAPGVVLPIRGIHMTRFDGDGGFTQLDHLIINGAPPALDWTPATGTYKVNSDCTGSMRIFVPSTGDFVNLRIVISGQGRQVHAIVTAPFNGPARTVTSTGTRRDY